MKKTIFAVYIMLLSVGCGHMFANSMGSAIRDSKYIIVKDVNDCKLLGTVSTWYAPNSKKSEHAAIAAINVLKKEIARSKFDSTNAIFNIHMTDKDFPLAKGDLYSCSEETLSKYKSLQTDRDYLYSLIIFDLKKDDMPTKPPEY
tara:strand:- start:45402 stop:45836 length:435 start_codon:yes stop_codon:yes gene_type:complete